MKTVVVHKDGSLEVREVPKPKCGPREAVVKTLACGLCGTDTKLMHRCFKGVPLSTYPLMLGHEGVGEVVEIGEEVEKYKLGDRVLIPYINPPDPVLYGELGTAWGGLSEYALVCDHTAYNKHGEEPPNDFAYAQTVIPADFDPIDSVILITFREVMGAINYFGVQPGHPIVVFGCGPVGLTFIKLLSLLGFTDIVAVDIVDDKLKTARNHGAKKTINSKTTDVTAAVRTDYPSGVPYVIDAVGLPSVANTAMSIIVDRGKIFCYGVLEKEQITLDFSTASYNWTYVAQQMPDKPQEGATQGQIVEWIKAGKLVMKDFISDYFEFDNVIEALQRYERGEITKKGIIVYK